MRSLLLGLFVLSAIALLTGAAGHSQAPSATITFDNRSGEPAVVKLIGPSGQTADVPNGQTRTVNAGAGRYYIVTRYGVGPGRYTYVRGDPFQVTQTATHNSLITITLHKVANGNYGTHSASAEEFDKAIAPNSAAQVPPPANPPASDRPALSGAPRPVFPPTIVAKDLIDASRVGDISRVKVLLAAKTDVNANINGNTALMTASYSGHVEVVQALLAAMADVNAKMANGGTALVMASQQGHLEVVQALLAAKADVNVHTNTGATALVMASQQGRLEVVRALLAANADVNAQTGDGTTALMVASQNGHLEVVRTLLAAKADVNAKALTGAAALILASQNGHPEVIRALIDTNADVNAKAANGVTALILASQNNQVEAVRTLLAAKADVNAKAVNGVTALMAASERGHLEVVRLLNVAASTVALNSNAAEVASPEKPPVPADRVAATVSPGEARNQQSTSDQRIESDLPFGLKGIVIHPGGSVDTDHDAYITHSMGMGIESLMVGDTNIPLKSDSLSQDMMISTQVYGDMKLKVRFGPGLPGAGPFCLILVTPQQEQMLRDLCQKGRCGYPAPSPNVRLPGPKGCALIR